MIYAVLALGSNIGDKVANIEKAYIELTNKNINIVCKSSLIETSPYGVENQEKFINSVILVKTDLYPVRLLKKLKKIEKKLGRYETFRWGPRVIDIDIIFYDNLKYESDDLIIPHKDYLNRSFVLEPLEEIKDSIISHNINF